MIDLDEQLAAYASYLDDTEQSVTVLHPRAVTPHGVPRRRFVAGAAAAAIVLAGTAAISVVRLGDDGATGTDESEWTVVPDPDGVFAAQSDAEPRFSNSVEVMGVTVTDDGFIAAGYERRGPTVLGVLWRSNDGRHWVRTAHDATFGSLTVNGSDQGAMMFDVDEHGGAVIVGGSETLAEDRQIWLSSDLRTWVTPDLPGQPDPSVVIRAVAAGPNGFVVAGVDVQDSENVDTSTVWFSPDGEHWTQADVEDALGAHLYDVIATDDGWYAAGSAASEAAVWRSNDGATWTRVDVVGSLYSGKRYSRMQRLVDFNGSVVGYGNAGSTTDFVSEPLMPVVWTEGDGTWTASGLVVEHEDRLYAGPIVSTPDGLIAFATDLTSDGVDAVEFRSADGADWERRVVGIGGPRNAAAAGHGVVVAVGYAESFSPVAPTTEPGEEVGRGGASSNVWILDD